MVEHAFSRRTFLRTTGLAAAAAASAACGSSPAPVATATAVPEPTATAPQVEPTATAAEPTAAPAEPTATAAPTEAVAAASKYGEAPMLAEMVQAGTLPPVEERLPKDPFVVEVVEEIGQYGGTWNMAGTGPGDMSGFMSYSLEPWVIYDINCESWIPVLAEQVEVSEDGSQYTFRIREGHKWSDGEPFTADDIVFWYEDYVKNADLNPAPPSWMTTGGELGVVEKVDDHTVSFKFSQPHGLFLVYASYVFGGGGGIGYPAHYLKQFHVGYADQAELDQMVKDAGLENWVQLFQNKVNYTQNVDLPTLRAWKVKEAKEPWIWERNPYYYKVDTQGNQLPYVDYMRFQPVADAQMVLMKAITGELDYQWRNIYTIDNYPILMENREKGGYRVNVATHDISSAATIYPNQNLVGDDVMLGLIQDVRFRQALNLGLNRDEIAELIYLGQQRPMTEAFPFYNMTDGEDLFQYWAYDPERANQILDEMGLQMGDDGIRLRPDGKPLAARIDVYGARKDLIDTIELVTSYWKDIGVKVEAETLSYELWGPRISSLEYHFCVVNHWNCTGISLVTNCHVAPVDGSGYWARDWVSWYTSGGQQGTEPTGDAKLGQDLFDQVKLTVDTTEQLDILTEMGRLFLKNMWTIETLGPGPLLRVVKNSFRNVPEGRSCVLWDADQLAEQYFIQQG